MQLSVPKPRDGSYCVTGMQREERSLAGNLGCGVFMPFTAKTACHHHLSSLSKMQRDFNT